MKMMIILNIYLTSIIFLAGIYAGFFVFGINIELSFLKGGC